MSNQQDSKRSDFLLRIGQYLAANKPLVILDRASINGDSNKISKF